MKMSKRAQRMDRHHKRFGKAMSFNLVSLMDIFTILVFFLLVNSSDGEVLPSTRTVLLPESIAEEKPRETVMVMVTGQDILLQGNKVAKVVEVRSQAGNVIASLKAALETQNSRSIRQQAGDAGREVTIMGDKLTSFEVLKKVMATCTQAGFGKISLAVLQKPPREG
jgi:biopolymer transport protein TolR